MIRVVPCRDVAQDNHSETKSYRRTILRLFKTLTWVLRIAAICTGQPLDEDGVDNHFQSHRTDHTNGCLHTFYSVIVMLYLWAYTGCLMYKVYLLELFSSNWIQTFQFLVLNLLASVLGTVASVKGHGGSFQDFTLQCDAYEKRYGTNKQWVKQLRINKVIVGVLITFWVVAPAVVLVSTIAVEEVGRNYFLFDGSLKWFNYILSYLNSQALICITSGLLVTAAAESLPLSSELDRVNTMFQGCFEDYNVPYPVRRDNMACQSQMDNGMRSNIVVGVICRHEHACQLVSSFSGCISFGIFTAFSLSLPMSCFDLYLLLTHVKSTQDVFLCTFNLALCMIATTLFVVTGARTNIKAHEPLQYVWRIPTSDLSDKAMRELMHFTAKLTGTSIGYSVYGFFTINLPTILTIFGTVLTYFVIVLQFRPSNPGHRENTLNNELVANLSKLMELMQNMSSLT